MVEVRVSKRQYHEQQDMIEWCRGNFGMGGWKLMRGMYTDSNEWKWDVESAFGTTFFNFVNEADAEAFRGYWKPERFIG